jgi:hypothetical protein
MSLMFNSWDFVAVSGHGNVILDKSTGGHARFKSGVNLGLTNTPFGGSSSAVLVVFKFSRLSKANFGLGKPGLNKQSHPG